MKQDYYVVSLFQRYLLNRKRHPIRWYTFFWALSVANFVSTMMFVANYGSLARTDSCPIELFKFTSKEGMLLFEI